MQVEMAKCKKRLATLWFFGAGLLFFLIIFQTFFGRYGEKADEAWKWLLPTIMPTLSLIAAVYATDTSEKKVEPKMVNRFKFRLSFCISAAYLITVSLSIFIAPFVSASPLELMRQSNLWLGPFQGLVSAFTGVFFIKGAQ